MSKLGPQPHALNLLLVNDITNFSKGSIAGLSPAPGLPFPQGTPLSLFAMGGKWDWDEISWIKNGNHGTDMLSPKLRDISFIIAYEMLHFLGLHHPASDLLDDTPSCEKPGSLSEENRKACPDYENMMFPIAGGGATITPQQRQLILLNPLASSGECNDASALNSAQACGPSCIDCTQLPGVNPATAMCKKGICVIECMDSTANTDGVWLNGCEVNR